MFPISPIRRSTRPAAINPTRKKDQAESQINTAELSYVVAKDEAGKITYLDNGQADIAKQELGDIELLFKKLSLGKTLYSIHDPEAFKRAISILQTSAEIVSSYNGQIPITST